MAADVTFFSAVLAALNLDLGFFIEVVMNNLAWVFIFFAINHALFKDKNLLRNFAMFSVYIWAFREFGATWGLGGFGIAPIIFFVLMALVQIFVLDTKLFGKHTSLADVCGFYSIIFFLNFFVR